MRPLTKRKRDLRLFKLLGGTPPVAQIIYIHVPKCGGSSFGAALRLRYFMSQATITLNQGDPNLKGEARILNDYRARGHELESFVSQGKRLIAGHVRYDPDLHSGAARNYSFVTMLRDPVDRFVSHYNYLQRNHPNPARPDTIEAFLETENAARLASQYLFYFAGRSQLGLRNPNLLIDHAIQNLSRFDVVGNLDDPSDFNRQLTGLTGFPLPRLKRNRAPHPAKISLGLRMKIEALCAADTAIFNAMQPRRATA